MIESFGCYGDDLFKALVLLLLAIITLRPSVRPSSRANSRVRCHRDVHDAADAIRISSSLQGT